MSLDLRKQTRIDQVTLKAPRTGTETFAAQTSLDGRGWSTLVAERPHRHVRATNTTAKIEIHEAAASAKPEPGQRPAVGAVTTNGIRFSDNFQDIRNTTTTFTITIN
ncbi:hypothetical protein [Lentzea nigeriaca]|uniref:hypothetical protein n=1 Tax=Lentzea nigeriaca TaxID=1128665 RepID=UPI00195BE3F8|nr:hypothetical protein [Lentzea nigeriaca]MBM7863085.1 hypothetical protein [Lentzea nigeriaca]